MGKYSKFVEVISTFKWSEGVKYAVYGVDVRFENGKQYRCADISCKKEDAERFASLLREERVLYEEMPFLAEDFVSSL